tara:strand:- start:578 stop:1318 length:741 start_codon:yes stop_codon:yes gene_type:complete
LKSISSLILSAGLGSRLGQKTKLVPKSLVHVNGVPIIDIQIDSLIKNNVSDIIVVVGYHKQILMKHLKSKWGEIVNFIFIENNDYDSTNSGFSFTLAAKYIDTKSYIHLNCDTIFTPEILNELINSSYLNQIVINTNISLNDNMEQVIVDSKGTIQFMDNKKTKNAIGKAMGLAKFDLNLVKFINARLLKRQALGSYNDNFYGIIRDIVPKKNINTILSNNNSVMDFNNSDELASVENKFNKYNEC